MSYLDPIDVGTVEFGDLYDELPLWSAPFGLWLLDRVPMRPGLTILDLGAGTGFLSLELAERCGDQATVISVDPWHAAAQRLRRKIAQRKLSNVRVLEQDAATIDLPDDSVDVLVSNLGVNNFADAAAVMRVCSRAAKPGASFLLTTNLVGHMAEFYDVFRTVLQQTGQTGQIALLEAHIQHRATVESVTKLLADARFKVEDVFRSSFRLRFANGSALLRHFFIRFGFLPAWKEIASADRVAETFAALERELDRVASVSGELALTIPQAGFVARKTDQS